jgi:hypothetical protein
MRALTAECRGERLKAINPEAAASPKITVHAGPKSQSGGFHFGKLRL